MPVNENLFFSQLLEDLQASARFPKVQLERALGPVMHRFMAPLMSTLLEEPVVMLAPEFPLMRGQGSQNLQSCNIDWLLYAPGSATLVLLELKTNVDGYRPEQTDIYRGVQQQIAASQSAGFLDVFIQKIAKNSQSSAKYQHLQQALKTAAWTQATQAVIVYLAPGEAPAHFSENPDAALLKRHWMRFADLPLTLAGAAFAAEWLALRTALHAIDRSEQQDTDTETKALGGYYKGSEPFESICRMAVNQPENLLIGYVGGAAALRQQPLDVLQARRFKYDDSPDTESTASRKIRKNWLTAEEFLAVVQRIGNPEIHFALSPAQQQKIQSFGAQWLTAVSEDENAGAPTLNVTFSFTHAGRSVRCSVDRQQTLCLDDVAEPTPQTKQSPQLRASGQRDEGAQCTVCGPTS